MDAWHLSRSNTDIDELRRVPGELVLGVQLDDGPATPEADLMHATLHERALPGEGQFELVALLQALRDIGAVVPVGVEVFSDDLHALGPEELAWRSASTTRRVMAEYA